MGMGVLRTLALWQWVVLIGTGEGWGWAVVLNFASDWPLWQQVLASAGVAFVWLTAISWVLELFRKPAADAQAQEASPGAQQGSADGNLAQSTGGHAVVTGDNSPVTIGEAPPPNPSVVNPGVQGQLKGPWIVIEIENPDDHEHEFGIRLISFEGLVSDSPKVENRSPAVICAREPIGPRQKSEMQIGQVDGGSQRDQEPYRTIYLLTPEGTGRWSRLPAWVPWGECLTFEIEILSDALMEQPQRSTWQLKLDDRGEPLGLTRML